MITFWVKGENNVFRLTKKKSRGESKNKEGKKHRLRGDREKERECEGAEHKVRQIKGGICKKLVHFLRSLTFYARNNSIL